jgi:hypothetical protein
MRLKPVVSTFFTASQCLSKTVSGPKRLAMHEVHASRKENLPGQTGNANVQINGFVLVSHVKGQFVDKALGRTLN